MSKDQREFLKRYLKSLTPEDGFCTHGELTIKKLTDMLIEDVLMTATRPGCWEASNMATVLISHGYRGL